MEICALENAVIPRNHGIGRLVQLDGRAKHFVRVWEIEQKKFRDAIKESKRSQIWAQVRIGSRCN